MRISLGRTNPNFPGENYAPPSFDRYDPRLLPMRKPQAEINVANRNGKLALNAMTPAKPIPRLANPTSA